MKRATLLFYVILFTYFYAKGQRYLSPIFPGTNSILDIQYGSNINYKGNSQNLTLDFYEPQGDTLSKRPLIIYIHGGGFVDTNQNKSLLHIVAFADSMTRRGYAIASINYRLDSSISNRAVINAMHDAKAAVRFFKKNASTYSLDTALFFIGGESAGAITALTANYINKISEVKYPFTLPATIDSTVDGLSGNSGYGSRVKATLCFCGGTKNVFLEPLFDTLAIVQNDQPILFVHGTSDPLIPVQYATELAIRATNQNIPNLFYTMNGAGHCPWFFPLQNSVAYLDTLIDYTVPFLYACVQQSTSVFNRTKSIKLNIYPNPTSGNAKILIGETSFSDKGDFLIQDFTGKIIEQKITYIENGIIDIDMNNYPTGLYLIRLKIDKENFIGSVLINR